MRNRALTTLLALAAATFVAAPALADESNSDLPEWRDRYDEDDIEAYSFGFYGTGMMTSVDLYGIGASWGSDEPLPLASRDLHLDGEGWAYGGGLRGTAQTEDGIRFGLGIGFYKLEGLDMLHEPLDPGVTATLGQVWMQNLSFSFGKAFDLTYLYPYIDWRTAINLVHTNVELDIDGYGFVGSTSYNVVSLTMAPRLGAFIPMDEDFYVDLSAQYGLFGIERLGGFVSFGVWGD